MSLPAMSKADRLLGSIVLLVAALVALVIWLVLPPEKTGGLVEQPSTFFNAGYGTKAAYLVLDRLGYPVTRLRRPLGDDALEGIGILVVLKPRLGLRPYELTELEAWVRGGHVLVVAPGSCIADAFAMKSRPHPPTSKPKQGEDKDSEPPPQRAPSLSNGSWSMTWRQMTKRRLKAQSRPTTLAPARRSKRGNRSALEFAN